VREGRSFIKVLHNDSEKPVGSFSGPSAYDGAAARHALRRASALLPQVTRITQIADRDRAKRRNLQFCDPGHLHPRRVVRRCIERNGDGLEGIFSASAGSDARSRRCGGSSCGGSFADSGVGR
jgi:hypothetical protein